MDLSQITVGGRNYILNSSGLNASDTARPFLGSNYTASSLINSLITYNSDSITLTYTGPSPKEWYYAIADAYQTYRSANLDKTKQYTISVDVKGTAPGAAFRINNIVSPSISLLNDTWKRLKYTFVFSDFDGAVGPDQADKFYIRLNATTSGKTIGNFVEGQTLSFRNFKLEEGNIATDWSPAPEDILTQSDYAKIKAAIVALGGSLS